MRLFTDETAHPLVLMRVLTRQYGVDWMRWRVPVLRQTVSRDFGVDMARVNVAKSMGAAAVATRDDFWNKWEIFHFLCQALNGHIPHAGELQEHSIGEMMVAVDIASAIRNELGELAPEPAYSEEVARYIAAQAKAQDVWVLPSVLTFAHKYSSGKSYRCLDCGHVDEEEGEEHCEACLDVYNTESLRSWEPCPDLEGRERGTNIELFEKNPSAAVTARLHEVVLDPSIELEVNQTDICVSRLLSAMSYVAHHRKQLDQGLTAL